MAPTPNFRTRHSTWVSRLVVANIKRRRSYKCAERHNHSHEQFGNIDKGINLWWGEKHTETVPGVSRSGHSSGHPITALTRRLGGVAQLQIFGLAGVFVFHLPVRKNRAHQYGKTYYNGIFPMRKNRTTPTVQKTKLPLYLGGTPFLALILLWRS
jgi:hypothetical protein